MIPTTRNVHRLVFAPAATMLAGALAVGCSSTNEIQAFLQQPRQVVSAVVYRVLPPDVLLIKSQHVPEIDGVKQQIRPDGKINLPLIGELYVADKTPAEIEDDINKLASLYYAEVDTNVQVVGFNSRNIYIFGEVHRRGPLPWTGHDTLLDALAQAQPTFLSWPENILVVRGSKPQEGGYFPPRGEDEPPRDIETVQAAAAQETSPKKIRIDLWAMVKTGDMAQNILLLPNDVIYVEPNPLAQVGLAIQTLLLPIRPAAETIRAPVGAVATFGG